jgi:hypothetical protein
MRWTAWLVASMGVAVCFSCAQGEDARNFIGETGGTGGTGGSSAAGGTGASAGEAGTGASAGEAGTGGGETGGTGGGETGGTGGTGETGGTGGSTGGTGGSTGGTGGSTGGTGGSTGGTGGSTGGTGGSTGGTGGSTGGTGGGTCVPPAAGECTVYPHAGCLSYEGCYVTVPATGQTECAFSSGYGPGVLCEFLNDCAPGSACVGGACKPYCSQPSNCPAAGADCFQVVYDPGSGTSQPVPCMKVCTDHCDPANPSVVCGNGVSCDVFSDQGVNPGTSLCYDSGSTNTGACSSASPACAPGWVCLTDNLCHRWCRVGLSDCTGCQAAGYYVGSQQYGFCP